MRIVWCALLAACGFGSHVDGPAIDARMIDAPSDGGAIDAPGCPANYAALGPASTSVYRVSGGPMSTTSIVGRATWVDANADCNDDGARTHLAIPNTQEEHQLFVDVLSGASRWLGVTDRKTEGSWLTITGGTAFWTYWPTQPANPTYDCLILTRVPSHEDSECNKPGAINEWLKGYICECDGAAPDPTTF